MKDDNTPTVTSRRRTPSARMRLRLETAKRIRAISTKYKSVRARKKAAKQNAAETDPEAHVLPTSIPRIKKNAIVDPPKATSKFQKRQIHKTWLPTHIWHAKRAHMTRPSEPLWRMAIPLSPTEKGYRPSHRASGGRGAIAWDMSYIATIGCEGRESSLIGMLKAVGFGDHDAWGAKGKRWRNGTRSASGWTYERDNEKKAIAPVTVLWAPEVDKSPTKRPQNAVVHAIGTEKEDSHMENTNSARCSEKSGPIKRKLLLRVHPSAFHQLWMEVLKVAKMQHPSISLEDLRFQIASLEIVGPGSTEALCATLNPITPSAASALDSAQTWVRLAGLTNPASLPAGATLTFNISDPRLQHPRKSLPIKTDESSHDELTDLIMDWPPDKASLQADIFSHRARKTASKFLLSQKAINRRKGQAQPGEPPSTKETDPQVPVMLLASRPHASASGAQGKWTILLPWKCLDPVWRCLMYYPLSSGGTPRFGGLDETRQIAFERNVPWFPGDFPGTEAGKAWERTESEKRFNVWNRKPPSRRVNYDSLKLAGGKRGELGKGWACDWEFLLALQAEKSVCSSNREEAHDSSTIPSGETGPAAETTTIEDKAPMNQQTSAATSSFSQLSPTHASTLLHPSANIPTSIPTNPCLATIRITLLTRGTPLPCARIYRLPSPSNPSLRSKWLSLDRQSSPTTSKTAKVRTNWRNDPRTPFAYPSDHNEIEAIDYRPPNMHPKAVEEWEKKKEKGMGKRERFQTRKKVMEQRRLEDGDGEVGVENMSTEERETLMRELMTPSADRHEQGGGEGFEVPGEEDLIGFVTSGGFNLARGRGMGVGGVWVQRVVQGWVAEGEVGAEGEGEGEAGRMRRERRLCIIRNAGEMVGRLGMWDVVG